MRLGPVRFLVLLAAVLWGPARVESAFITIDDVLVNGGADTGSLHPWTVSPANPPLSAPAIANGDVFLDGTSGPSLGPVGGGPWFMTRSQVNEKQSGSSEIFQEVDVRPFNTGTNSLASITFGGTFLGLSDNVPNPIPPVNPEPTIRMNSHVKVAFFDQNHVPLGFESVAHVSEVSIEEPFVDSRHHTVSIDDDQMLAAIFREAAFLHVFAGNSVQLVGEVGLFDVVLGHDSLFLSLTFETQATPVPEPTGLALFAVGSFVLLGRRAARRRAVRRAADGRRTRIA